MILAALFLYLHGLKRIWLCNFELWGKFCCFYTILYILKAPTFNCLNLRVFGYFVKIFLIIKSYLFGKKGFVTIDEKDLFFLCFFYVELLHNNETACVYLCMCVCVRTLVFRDVLLAIQ